jgi:hypothetical protein
LNILCRAGKYNNQWRIGRIHFSGTDVGYHIIAVMISGENIGSDPFCSDNVLQFFYNLIDHHILLFFFLKAGQPVKKRF